MSTPGVGTIVALTYAAAIDDPARFSSSKTVGAHFGLTPTRYQSGETDRTGRISKIGDGSVRAALYESRPHHPHQAGQGLRGFEELGDADRQTGRHEESEGGACPQTRRHHASDAGRWHDLHDPTSVAPCSAPSRTLRAACGGGQEAILDGACARRSEAGQVGTWRNRGVTTAGTGWPPRNAKGARPCPRASSMSASMYH